MKLGPIIHQQVAQLKWHFLACLGLIMVLPLEEAVVNWRDGAGFYAAGMAVASVFLSPLLAGLIACANVQADLDDRRYTFWRSKPVGTASFMTLKFAVGLILALVIFACPVMFGLIGDKMYPRAFDRVGAAAPIYWNFLLITVMAYSFCFLCNVLMRKTAQAWLIGIAVSCFLLVVPFILPLNLKEIGDFITYLSHRTESLLLPVILFLIVAVPALSAFILSLIAVAHNWRLQTNLKGLLWTGAAVIFLLAMLFTRQIANIKVLDEIQTPETFYGRIGKTDNQIFGLRFGTIQIENDKIKLNPVDSVSRQEFIIQRGEKLKTLLPEQSGLRWNFDIYSYPIYTAIENKTLMISMSAYYHQDKTEHITAGRKYEKLYVCVFEINDGFDIPASVVDVSDFLKNNNHPNIAMRKIDDKLLVVVNQSYMFFEIESGGQLKILDKKIDVLRPYYAYGELHDTVQIHLIPIEQLDVMERIEFSIDIVNRVNPNYNMTHSRVDIVGDKISFCRFSKAGIVRYDVDRWDDKSIYGAVRDGRPFTLLEQMFSGVYEWNNSFVQDGKLYIYGDQKLMVFDIRSERIRKLGHWERIRDDFTIRDVEILDDGNILLTASERQRYDNGKQWEWKRHLYLLKNPE